MASPIQEAWERFLVAVGATFKTGKAEASSSGSLRLLVTDDQRLQRLIETVEQRPEFAELVRATTAEFLPEAEAETSAGLQVGVCTYLRLSGFYQRAFAEDCPAALELPGDYVDAFTRPTNRVTYLAPLQFVSFAADVLSCGSFEVRRFEADELSQMFRNDARRLFYPYSQVDTEQLAQNWFICVTKDVPRERLGYVEFRYPMEWSASASTRFPAALERALRYVALYDWHKATEAAEGSAGKLFVLGDRVIFVRPRVPFFMSLSDSLIEWPDWCPDLASAFGIRRRVGEFELETACRDPFRLNVGETERFAAFMREISMLVDRIEAVGPRWSFVDKALEFVWRGFSCESFEQILWNTTAIEAFLGEKLQSGLTKVLGNRLSAVLSDTLARQKAIRKRFFDIYSTRSDYIHGNAGAKSGADPAMVFELREFARRVGLWMLRYLAHIQTRLCDQDPPTREALLQALDMDRDRRKDMGGILSALPECYPAVAEWLD